MMPMSRWWLMSFSCATGMMRRSTNSLTVSWMASCSSVRSRFKTCSLEACERRDPMSSRLRRASAGERHAPRPARALGAVQRQVGGAEQTLRVAALVGVDGQPEADRDALQPLILARADRLGDAFDDRAG